MTDRSGLWWQWWHLAGDTLVTTQTVRMNQDGSKEATDCIHLVDRRCSDRKDGGMRRRRCKERSEGGHGVPHINMTSEL